MVYSEHFVGFWLSFTLPTICYLICPIVLWYFKKSYTLAPPTGSVLPKAWKLVRLAFKGRGSWNPTTFKKNMRDPAFWEVVKPSAIRARGETVPEWMTFDDEWVDEVRRGLLACKVFLWYPLYWLAYNQMMNNLTSQASTMNLGSTPNDIVAKLNPLFIIIVIPIMDFGVYPAIRKMGFNCSYPRSASPLPKQSLIVHLSVSHQEDYGWVRTQLLCHGFSLRHPVLHLQDVALWKQDQRPHRRGPRL